MATLSRAKAEQGCFALIMKVVMSSSEHMDLISLWVRRALNVSRRLIALRLRAEEPKCTRNASAWCTSESREGLDIENYAGRSRGPPQCILNLIMTWAVLTLRGFSEVAARRCYLLRALNLKCVLLDMHCINLNICFIATSFRCGRNASALCHQSFLLSSSATAVP
jgi:hypothetical protein